MELKVLFYEVQRSSLFELEMVQGVSKNKVKGK